jgi:hypothetical protein
MENSPALKSLIKKNAHLFWYTKEEEKENLPVDVVLEFFINYAEKETIKSLFNIIGIQTAPKIFFEQKQNWGLRNNLYPELDNFFTLYFNKYAS